MARYTAEITLSEFDDKNLVIIAARIVNIFRKAREDGNKTIWIDVESDE